MRHSDFIRIHKLFGIISLITLMSLFYSPQSVAANSCSIYSGNPAFTETVNLGGLSTTIGADTPNGSEVFRMAYSPVSNAAIDCKNNTTTPATFTVPYKAQYVSNPKPLSTGNQGAYPGKVYETGVTGLGVIILATSGGSFTMGSNIDSETYSAITSTNQQFSRLRHFSFTLILIKTGPISPGIVSGANLPSVSVSAATTAGVTGLPILMQTLKFTGQLNIASQSCTTPDVNVNLGTYPVQSTFTGIGSTTTWMDSSIKLTNCPAFMGTYTGTGSIANPTNPAPLTTTGTSTLTAKRTVSNSVNITLTPTSTILDGTQGIFALSNLGSAGVASGVGIQIAYGNITSSMAVANLGAANSVPVKNSTATDITIPLGARYIQTDESVQPGVANGKLTFLINYQ